MRLPCSTPFLAPINPEKDDVADYFSVISTPMDFGTIMVRLNENTYAQPGHYYDDVNLVLANSYKYNTVKVSIINSFLFCNLKHSLISDFEHSSAHTAIREVVYAEMARSLEGQ